MAEVRIVESEEAPVYYINATRLGAGVYDFVLLLGRVEGAFDNSEPTIRSLAKVIMSPQHAKAFAAILTSKVQEYEEKYGSIPSTTAHGGEDNNPPSAS